MVRVQCCKLHEGQYVLLFCNVISYAFVSVLGDCGIEPGSFLQLRSKSVLV